uniref:Peptidase C76 domain-containing protein n=1 Tax=Strongyloides venezuelensis TaxID=75913 RepID=A0A0K0FGH7_STRVS
MEFVNNLLKKVCEIDIPKDFNCETADSEHHKLRRDFVRSKHVIILNEDVKLSHIFETNEIVKSIMIKNNSEIIKLIKTIKNKEGCARGMVIKNDYVPVNSKKATIIKILRADMCQATLEQNNQCVAISSAALIMACIKTPLNWKKLNIINVLNQGNILYERCISHLRTQLRAIHLQKRGKKVKRNEIAFGFVSLSEAFNRIVNEHMFLILIANERASSIIHHDRVFFLFDPHSMDQNKRYCSKGVSFRKKTVHLSKNRNNKEVDSNLNEKTSLLKIKYDKCKRLSEKKKITTQLNRLENKSIDTVKKNFIETLKINKVVDNNPIKVFLINNEEAMEVEKCENDSSNLFINFDGGIDFTLKEIIVIESKIKNCKRVNEKKKL